MGDRILEVSCDLVVVELSNWESVLVRLRYVHEFPLNLRPRLLTVTCCCLTSRSGGLFYVLQQWVSRYWYCMILLLKYMWALCFLISQYFSSGNVSVSVNEHSHSVKYSLSASSCLKIFEFHSIWLETDMMLQRNFQVNPCLFKLRPSWSTCVMGWFWITYNPQHDLLKRLTYSHIQSRRSQSYPLTKSAIFLTWDPIGCSIRAIWHTWWFSLSQ